MILGFLLAFVYTRLALSSCPPETVVSSIDSSVCYKFVQDAAAFINAEADCKKSNGHLTSVENGFANAFINEEAQVAFPSSKAYYIGATDLAQYGNWSWIDGSRITFKNWASGEPKSGNGYDCGTINAADGTWKSSNCFQKRPYVCLVPQLSSACPPPPTCPTARHELTCETEWTLFNGNCYKVGDGLDQKFWDAQDACSDDGANLASIHSAEENGFVQGLTRTGMSLKGWIHQVWIGQWYDHTDAKWKWTDGSDVDYTLWALGEPNYDGNKTVDSCVEMYADEETDAPGPPVLGSWNDIHCGAATMRVFVCKKPATIF
jgi:C-type mannose receptor